MSSRTPFNVVAIDLGSNSFHMVAAHHRDGALVVVDRLRDQVQLAAGLDERGRIATAAKERALEALERFGQRVRGLEDLALRAVGTNTFRAAQRDRAFRKAAEEKLGHPIEVISGEEEARLVFLGVAHAMGPGEQPRLVVDIGGGSTECIVGRGFSPDVTTSCPIGCVSWSRRFFPEGRVKKGAFEKAVLAARRELHGVARAMRGVSWERAVGSSGTIKAVGGMIRETEGAGEGAPITPAGLARLRARLIDAGHAARAGFSDLKSDREDIIAGGIAILTAVFESLDVQAMEVSQGALREGVLYDLIGRFHDDGVRERSVRLLQQRFGAPMPQAERVERRALELFDQVREVWDLDEVEHRPVLAWAARLHEIGLAIAHARHHRHAAYVLTHAELPGFSRDEQAVVAAVVGNHRKKPRREDFEDLPAHREALARRLCLLLRLATVVERGREPAARATWRLTAKGSQVRFELVGADPGTRPLTRLDLAAEADHLEILGFTLDPGA